MAGKRALNRSSIELSRIMNTYRRAWERREATLVLRVFTQDATYQENPFRAPFAGREAIGRYWKEATGRHRDVRFEWQAVCRSGVLHVVEWSVRFTRADSGKRRHLRGVMFLELRGKRVSRFREYWLSRENT